METLIKNVAAIAVVLFSTVIPSIVGLIKAVKAKKEAKTEAEKATANSDMREQAVSLIVQAEKTFADINSILKANGKSAGALKKKDVMSSLQQYALDKGYAFDFEYWSEKVEEIVTLTKEVNK